jgi:hypothetical protein
MEVELFKLQKFAHGGGVFERRTAKNSGLGREF